MLARTLSHATFVASATAAVPAAAARARPAGPAAAWALRFRGLACYAPPRGLPLGAPRAAPLAPLALPARRSAAPSASRGIATAADEEAPSPAATPTDHSNVVFVRNLPQNATVEDVITHFRQFAPVAEVKLPVRHSNGRPLGFAFVHLEDAAQADHVVEKARYTRMSGRPIYVRRSFPRWDNGDGEAARERNARTLYVGNIPLNATVQDLRNHFAELGDVKDVFIAKRFAFKQQTTYGFVKFANPSDAEKAAEASNCSQFLGSTLNVTVGRGRAAEAPQKEAAQLFVGNVHFQATPDELTEFYRPFGAVKSVQLLKRSVDGRPSGRGYVEFETVEAAKKAKEATDGQLFRERKLKVEYSDPLRLPAEPVQEVDTETIVYVDNLPSKCTPAGVGRHFAKYGTVEDVAMPFFGDSGRARGYAWVRFSSRESAMNAINSASGVEFMGKRIRACAHRDQPPKSEDSTASVAEGCS